MPAETPEKVGVEKKEKRDKKAHKSEKKRSREEDTVSDSGRKHKKSKRLSGDAELIDIKKEKRRKRKRKSKGGDETGEEDGGKSEEKEHKSKKHNDDIEDEEGELKEKEKKKKKKKKDKSKRNDDEIEDEEGESKEMKKKHTSKKYSDEIEDDEVEKGEKNKKKKHRSKKNDEEIDDTEKSDKKKHKSKKHLDSKDRADRKKRRSEKYDDKSDEAMDVDTEVEAIDEAEDESVVEPEYEAIAATQEEARVEARRGLAAEFEDETGVISDDEVVAETEDEAVAETEVGTEVGTEVETGDEDESEIEAEAEFEAETAQSESESSLGYKSKRAATDAMDLDEPTATTDIYQPPDIPVDPQFPFFSQTVSLYVPINPSGWDKPVTICKYGYLLNLQNQYVPSLRGVLMKYKNVALGANPSRVGAITTDDDENPVLLRTQREYGVGYGYVTADVDLFVPSRGAWMEGSINLQTAGHIGVVCWGRFNAAIEARRLPPSWRWVAREDMEAEGTGNTTPMAGLGLERELGLNAPLDEHGAAYQQIQMMGFWVDANGDKVKGRVRFRIRNFEVGVSGKTSYLSLEGTMLDKASEKALMRQEAEAAKERHEIETDKGTWYARRLASEFGTTRFMSEEEKKVLEERRAAAAEDRAAAVEAEAATAAIAAAAATETSAPKRGRVVRKN